MKKLLVAAAMLVLATPAFAAIQNVKVSGDITASYIDLSSFDLGATSGGVPVGLKKESNFITQTRLRVDADLSDNVSTTVGLINERAWNAENNSVVETNNVPNATDTNVQLYLASVTLREFLYSPLTVTIGRQVFNYGNGFVMGDGGAINQGAGNLQFIDQDLTERTAYDGVTATLDYKPLTISLIGFRNDETAGAINGSVATDGQRSDVYGYNVNYQLSDPWNTVVEQYMFNRFDGSNTINATNAKNNTLYVPGLRASTNPTKSLNLQGEVAWQLGNIVVGPAATQLSEHRDAFAAQFIATYQIPVLEKYKPSVNASYTYVSGDKDAGTNYNGNAVTSAKTYSAWDEFNSIQGAGTIYRAIFPMSNESIVEVGASANPLEDVTAGVTWSGLWAVTPYGANNPLQIYQPNNGSTLTTITGTNHNGYWLGNETDLSLTYNYTEDVTFGLSMGWFVPGDVFTSNVHDTASQAIANIGVKF